MTNQRSPEDEHFEARTRAAFDASVESLDGRTRSKLTQARHAALEELRNSSRQRWQRAGTALAGLSAAVMAVWIAVGQFTPTTPGELVLDDMDLVAEAPNLELLEEVEFYAWVARERAGGVVESGQVSDGSG
jgi:hypothetical protein